MFIEDYKYDFRSRNHHSTGCEKGVIMVNRVRVSGLEDFAYLFDQMDRMAQEITGSNSGSRVSTLPVDLCDNGDEVIIRAFVPGLSTDHLDLEIEQGVLTITGELPSFGVSEQHQQWTWYTRELRSGTFRRSISLPFKVEQDKIKAQIDNGVLWVKLPKAPEARPYRISVSQSNQTVHELSATN